MSPRRDDELQGGRAFRARAPRFDAGIVAAPSALPSVLARAVAFAAIVISAVCGGLVGYAISTFECSRGCVGPSLTGTAIGALTAAVGVAAIATLVLRSMSEWADQAPVTHRRRGWRSALRRVASKSEKGTVRR